MRKNPFLIIIVFLTLTFFLLPVLTQPVSAFINQELILLPENNRYFQYKGLPFVSFSHLGNLSAIPKPKKISESDVVKIAEKGNHLYMSPHAKKTRASFKELYNELNNTSNWNQVHSIAQWAHENDVMVSIIFWSFSWNFACAGLKYDDPEDEACFMGASGSDMVRKPKDPLLLEYLGAYGLPGVTRMDLHRLAIEKTVQATWEFPNVTYNMMWEYGYHVRDDHDPGGAFYCWWVDKMKSEGKKINPAIDHLFSVEPSGAVDNPPGHYHADFVTLEGAITRNHFSDELMIMNAPIVHWSIAETDDGEATVAQVRDEILKGFHPADNFSWITSDALRYFLQARWYLENIRTWKDEDFPGGGDEINSHKLPGYTNSSRPTLTNPSGYTNGAKVSGGIADFSVIYTDSNNNPPAQAEVWVDRNNDGRFNPNPSRGERISLQGSGTDYSGGVTYSASGITATYSGNQDLDYVFRFADKNWYPPEIDTGVVPSTWYAHWTLANFPGSNGLSPTPTSIPTATPTPPPNLKQLLLNWFTSTLDQNSDGKVNSIDFTNLLL